MFATKDNKKLMWGAERDDQEAQGFTMFATK